MTERLIFCAETKNCQKYKLASIYASGKVGGSRREKDTARDRKPELITFREDENEVRRTANRQQSLPGHSESRKFVRSMSQSGCSITEKYGFVCCELALCTLDSESCSELTIGDSIAYAIP